MLDTPTIPTPARLRRAALIAVALVLAAVPSPASAQAPCPNENRLYFSDSGMGPVGFVNLLNQTFTTVPAPGSGQAEGIAINRSLTKAYVVEFGTNQLREIDLATGTSVPLTSSLSGPRGIELNAAETDAWVTNETAGTLVSVNLGTGTITPVAGSLNAPNGFAVDSAQSTAYVAEASSGSIVLVQLGSGTVLPSGITGITAPRDVAMNFLSSQLYITDTAAGTLYKVPASGGLATVVTSLLFNPVGVAVDSTASFAYVAENGGFIKQVPLFGGMTPTPVVFTSGDFAGLELTTSPCQVATLSPTIQAPGTGSRIAVSLHIDMRNSSETLGSYGATLSWLPSVLSFVSATGGDVPFDTPIINTTNAAAGSISMADADADGAAGVPRLLCMEFDVIGPTNTSSDLNLSLTSITGAGTFSDLSSTAVADFSTIDVQGLCTVGDVNGNDLINSGDSLIILSHEVMLPLPGNLQAFIDARCGDTNGDALTDSTDANVDLTFEVGLPVNPSFPLNKPLQTFDSCPPAPAAQPLVSTLEAAVAEAPSITTRLAFSTSRPKKGDLFEVAAYVDMGASGMALGSYGAQLQWPAGVADFVGIVRGPAGAFPRPLLNSSEAAQGILRMAQANPAGTPGDVELLRVQFRARHALPQLDKTFGLKFSSLATSGPEFRNLLSYVAQVPLQRAGPAR